MIWLTHAHPGHSVILLPWEFQFASDGALWIVLGIAVFTILAACLPFLAGYRLGERVPYSPIRHIEYTLLVMLLPFGILVLSSSGSMNFGLSLTLLLYLPAILMIEAVIALFSSRGEWFLILTVLPAYFFYCTVIAWILLLLDRRLYKTQSTVDPGIQ
ncbi:MAG: hypothetical protein BWY31_00691 [Lentisphaerae bacterium ADurb.Bin242]|nr:MAG: hypothetical protein BWY31_00691 [Lentisphaerae bacterium ADurb.Bin242]